MYEDFDFDDIPSLESMIIKDIFQWAWERGMVMTETQPVVDAYWAEYFGEKS